MKKDNKQPPYDNDDQFGYRENIGRPLEEWELREYREDRVFYQKMLQEWRFNKQIVKFIGRMVAYGAGATGAIWAGKDVIWRVIKAAFDQ